MVLSLEDKVSVARCLLNRHLHRIVEAIGYFGRILSHNNGHSLILYLMQSVTIIQAPVFFVRHILFHSARRPIDFEL